MAAELGEAYRAGDLALVAGAGVSRSSGLPGWEQMIASIRLAAREKLEAQIPPQDLDAVLDIVHRGDPISTADSLQRLLGGSEFRKLLYAALYPGNAATETEPATVHLHVASLLDQRLMPTVFTSNYDDLLEEGKKRLAHGTGRVVHFHGRMPRAWEEKRGIYDPPVITSRDYYAAEDAKRYDKLTVALRDKKVLLVGFSLSDPNLTRVIRNEARDCRAILVASPYVLSNEQQQLRIKLLHRFWTGLNVDVTVIEAHEELPAFLMALRKEILRQQGQSPSELGAQALRTSVVHGLSDWRDLREWRDTLRAAVTAAKESVDGVPAMPGVFGDATLSAGFYAIGDDGYLSNIVTSDMRESDLDRPRPRFLAESPKPWGTAGYVYAAGVPVGSSASGGAFDRNVPEAMLLEWQAQRAMERRLPTASAFCAPAWVRSEQRLLCVGVVYFASQRPTAFDNPGDDIKLQSTLEAAFGSMIKREYRVVKA